MEDATLRDSESLPAAADQSNCDLRDQQLAAYMADSLANDDPFAANLGAVNGDLMLLEYRIRQALEGVLGGAPGSFEAFQAAMPGIDGYLKVTKQIDRFSQLAIKLAAGRAGD